MADTAAITRKLDLGRVVRDTISVVRRRAAALFGVTFALYVGLTILIVALAVGAGVAGVFGALSKGDMTAASVGAGLLGFVVAFVLIMLLAFVVYGFQISIGISELEGRTLAAGEALQISLKRSLPLFGAGILTGIGTALGMVLFIVPGVMLAVAWAVTMPAVVEGGGVLAGLQRSRDLTRGNRWRIFGLAIALFVAMLVIQGVLGAIFGLEPNETPGVLGIIGSLVMLAYSLTLSVALSTGLAALYVQLREIKGGGGESVAQVFS